MNQFMIGGPQPTPDLQAMKFSIYLIKKNVSSVNIKNACYLHWGSKLEER